VESYKNMENLIYELGTKDAIINERNEEIKKLKEEKHSLYHDKEKLINEIGTKDAIINERNEEIKKLQGNINNERQEKKIDFYLITELILEF